MKKKKIIYKVKKILKVEKIYKVEKTLKMENISMLRMLKKMAEVRVHMFHQKALRTNTRTDTLT